MNPEVKELLNRVDSNISLLNEIRERDEKEREKDREEREKDRIDQKKDRDNLKKILYGENNNGLLNDVKDIKETLQGNEYDKEGLIEKVKRHDKMYSGLKSMGSFSLILISVGGAIGTFLTWFIHNFTFKK